MARVTLDMSAIEARFEKANKKATFATAEQALKDCNYYCKQDQDGLIDSSLINSDLENGKLKWKTPYARYQYYLDKALKDKNPNARKMWAHYAKSIHGKEWLLVYDTAFKKYAKE